MISFPLNGTSERHGLIAVMQSSHLLQELHFHEHGLMYIIATSGLLKVKSLRSVIWLFRQRIANGYLGCFQGSRASCLLSLLSEPYQPQG